MPRVIVLKDGRTAVILSERDIIDLIEEYAGSDLRSCISAVLEEAGEDKKTAESDLQETEKELDQLMDHQHEVLCTVREEADCLLSLLSESRLDRKKLHETALSIWNAANNEL